LNAVLDASAAAALVLPDEDSSRIQSLLNKLDSRSEIFIPSLWWFEIANILLVAGKRKRITLAQSETAMKLLMKLPVVTDDMAGNKYLESLVSYASRHGLSAYDAAYLELAKRKKAVLVSSDKMLCRAAKKEEFVVF